MLTFNNVSIKYLKNQKSILKNISFEINPGDCIGIIGKSGSGKTTLFNALTMQAIISDGKVVMNNLDLVKKNKSKWRNQLKNIGYMSQQPNLIEFDNPYLSIKRDYMADQKWYCKFLNILNYSKKLQIYQNLENLDILEKAYTRNDELSQGQKQRVEIAKIFLKKPFLILADEPTAALDKKNANDVLILIKKFAKKNKAMLLINIHDVELARKHIPKILAIKDGLIYCFKKTSELSDSDLENIYN